uniref:Retinoic acid receptor responder protein 3like [Myotis lucifugus] n=1 Tax=Lepeophtheirus salmonis TaxID=72036 RepID=A0A0K2SYI8_LEPSM
MNECNNVQEFKEWEINIGMESINRGRRSKLYTLDDWDEFIKRVKIGDCIEIERTTLNHWCLFVGPQLYEEKDKYCKKWNDKEIQQVFHITGNSFISSSSSSSYNKSSNNTELRLFVDVVQDSKFRINNEFDFEEEPRSIDMIVADIKEILNIKMVEKILNSIINSNITHLTKEYNILTYNCEHFVKYIRNQKESSEQSYKLVSTFQKCAQTALSFIPFFSPSELFYTLMKKFKFTPIK